MHRWQPLALVIAASIVRLVGVVVFSQGDAGTFNVLERLPGVEANGPSEFVPLAVGSGHVVLFGHSDIALFRKASGISAATLSYRSRAVPEAFV